MRRSLASSSNRPGVVFPLAALLVLVACGSDGGGGGKGSGQKLWIADSSGKLGTVDLESGEVAVIGSIGAVMSDIARASDGKLFGTENAVSQRLFAIDPATGVGVPVGSTGAGVNSLAFGPDGVLLGASTALYSLDKATGASTPIGSGGVPYVSSGDLVWAGGRLLLSAIGTSASNDRILQLNLATGSATVVGPTGFPTVYGLCAGSDGTVYAVSGTKVLTIDPATGAGTLLFDYAGKGLGAAYGADIE